MTIKAFSKLLVVLALTLNGTLASAATDRDAVAACSEAIAEMFERKQGADVRARIGEHVIDLGRRLTAVTLFHVEAVNPATDAVIGKFDCVVNRQAKVRSLRTMPLVEQMAEDHG